MAYLKHFTCITCGKPTQEIEIDISSINQEDFFVKPNMVFGHRVNLIYPKAFPKWNESNKMMRSVLTNENGDILSLGFRKFTNFGEQPDFEPLNLKDKLSFITKLDGSLLICSKYKGNLITRTRGTVDARNLENGHEIDGLIVKYSKIFNNDFINSEQYSLLCEWTTPNNVIVLKESAEPKLWLIGIICHDTLKYVNQKELDILASEWDIDRPKRYDFNTFTEMKDAVEKFEGVEGVVIYSSDGQTLKKVKSLKYLSMHRFKSDANIDHVIDLFFEYNCPNYEEFKNKLIQNFDYECFTMVQGFISKICDAYKEVNQIIEGMREFLDKRKDLTRKDLALQIISSYGKTNRAAFLFTILDKGKLENDNLKKLLHQTLG